MLIWPAEMAVQNRDNPEDPSPPSAGEIGRTRAIGVAVLVGGIYLLYRMLGGTWGAGPPGVPFDPVLI